MLASRRFAASSPLRQPDAGYVMAWVIRRKDTTFLLTWLSTTARPRGTMGVLRQATSLACGLDSTMAIATWGSVMFSVTIQTYTLLCVPDGLPEIYAEYVLRARLADEFGLETVDGRTCFVALQEGDAWPFLLVAQRYSPAGGGFHPGVVLLPDTRLLFVGAGERLLAYRLDRPERLWEDMTAGGFWGWRRHGTFVLMAAELELSAWDAQAQKLWTKSVEPPWHYAIESGAVHLDVMGQKSSFPLATGPVR